LEKDRDRRYATALDLAEGLRRVREHEPILAKPANRGRSSWRWSERDRRWADGFGRGSCVARRSFDPARRGNGRERSQRAGTLEKKTALDDYGCMTDQVILDELVKESAALWPAPH